MAKGRRSEGKPDRRSEEETLKLPPGVKLLRTLEGHQDIVLSVAFDTSGRTLASGSSDTSVILWDAASGRRAAGDLRVKLLGYEEKTILYTPL